MARHGDASVGIHAGDQVFRAAKLCPARHVVTGAVAVPGPHDDLQRILGLQHSVRGKHLQLLDLRISGTRPGRSGGNPVGQQGKLGRRDVELHAAAMRHRQRWLLEEETLLRLQEVDAAALVLAGQYEMVVRRRIAAQRQLEAALAGQCTVARTGIAAQPRQHRDNIIAEGIGKRLLEATDLDTHARLLTLHLGRDLGGAVADGPQDATLADLRNGRVRGGKLGVGGHVAHDHARLFAEQDQSLTGLWS